MFTGALITRWKQPSFHQWMYEQTICDLPTQWNTTQPSKGNPATGDNRDEPCKHYAMWNKPASNRKHCVSPLIGSNQRSQTGSWVVAARGWGQQGVGSCCLMKTQLYFVRWREFGYEWGWCVCIQYQWTVHLKMDKMVNFMLHVFCHNY